MMTTFYFLVWGWLGILLHWVSDYKTVSFLLCFFKKNLKIARVIKSCKVAQRLFSFSGSSFITTEWEWAPARELTSFMDMCSYQCVRCYHAWRFMQLLPLHVQETQWRHQHFRFLPHLLCFWQPATSFPSL